MTEMQPFETVNMEDPTAPGMVTVAHHCDHQGITLWLGDAFPITVTDETAEADLREYVSHPIQRAVVAARMRVMVEILESAT